MSSVYANSSVSTKILYRSSSSLYAQKAFEKRFDLKLVSVVIPTYNYGRFVEEAIRSVLVQTYSETEILVVDDGSTDGTDAIVSAYRDTVQYIKQCNMGVSAARNRGVAEANGSYIAFLDADDVWMPRKLELQLDEAEGSGKIGLVYCGMYYIDQHGRIVGEEKCRARSDTLRSLLVEGNVITGSSSAALVPTRLIKTLGGFDMALSLSADWDMWIRIASSHRVACIAEPLLKYRIHSEAMHYDRTLYEAESLGVVAKFFATLQLNHPLHRYRRRSLSNAHVLLAGISMLANQPYSFIRNLYKAVYLDPRIIGALPSYVPRAIRWRNLTQVAFSST